MEIEYLDDTPDQLGGEGEEEVEQKRKKKSYRQKLTEEWLQKEEFRSWLERNPNKPEEPYCIICAKSIKGGTHIQRHSNTVLHMKKLKSAEETPAISNFYNKKLNEKLALKVKTAELKLVTFIAEHNLAFSVLDHLPQLIASICEDFEIAKKIKCCKKKGTAICKGVMTKESLYILSKTLQASKFSLIIEESTDVSVKKNLVLVARFYNKATKKVCDKFAALLEVMDASADAIYKSILAFFETNKIPINNLIGFAADNASTMMGNKGGVKQKLLELNPN